jgi:hypothetical protein
VDQQLERALLSWRMAPCLCPGKSDSFDDACTHYHRLRPLLRYLGLATQPSDQEPFFRAALWDAIRAVGREVLISGASDEGMAELVLTTTREAQQTVSITVVDRCRTPLLINEKFAEDEGAVLSTIHSDFLALPPMKSCDVLVTHSLLGQFPEEKRPALFRAWQAVMKPGARLITVFRVSGSQSKPRLFSRNDGAELRREVGNRLQALPPQPGLHHDEVLAEIDAYVAARRSNPIRSVEEVTDALEQAGFAVKRSSLCRSVSRTKIIGPAMPAGADYAEIVAERV